MLGSPECHERYARAAERVARCCNALNKLRAERAFRHALSAAAVGLERPLGFAPAYQRTCSGVASTTSASPANRDSANVA